MIALWTVLAAILLMGLATFCYGPWGPVARWRQRRLMRRLIRKMSRAVAGMAQVMGLALIPAFQQVTKAMQDFAVALEPLRAALAREESDDS